MKSAFDKIMAGLNDAIAFARGNPSKAKLREFPAQGIEARQGGDALPSDGGLGYRRELGIGSAAPSSDESPVTK